MAAKKEMMGLLLGLSKPKGKGAAPQDDDDEERDSDAPDGDEHEAKLDALKALREAMSSDDDEAALDAFETLCALCSEGEYLAVETVGRIELVTRARQRADMVGAALISSSEANDLIDQGMKGLYDLLIKSWGEDYFLVTAQLTYLGGTSAIILPDDFYRLVDVRTQDTGGYWRPMRPFMRHEEASWKNAALSGATTLAVYRLRQKPPFISQRDGVDHYNDAIDLLDVRPVLSTDRTVEIDYIPQLQAIETTNDFPNDVLYQDYGGWAEWAVLDAAIRMMVKEESDSGPLMAEREKLEQRILEHAPERDRGYPERVQDVKSGGYYDGCDELDDLGIARRWW